MGTPRRMQRSPTSKTSPTVQVGVGFGFGVGGGGGGGLTCWDTLTWREALALSALPLASLAVTVRETELAEMGVPS